MFGSKWLNDKTTSKYQRFFSLCDKILKNATFFLKQLYSTLKSIKN